MKPVDVAHIITRLDRGGSAQNTLISAAGQARSGRKVALVSGLSLESGMSPQEADALQRDLVLARAAGVRFFVEPNLVRRISPGRDLLALFGLARLLARLRPGIVHTHTSKAGILGRAAALLCSSGPAVVHTPHGHVFEGYFGPVKTGLFILLERLFARAAAAMVALTPREREDHLALKIGSPGNFFVVPSGVEIEGFAAPSRPRDELRRELGIRTGEVVATTVGRLVEVKGHSYLIEAAARVCREKARARFVIVGDGHLRNSLESRAQRLGISARVVFTGFRSDVADILHASDIFVLTSLNEGMGRVLVEAMAAGLPIVAFGVGGVPDLVTEDVGVLIEPFSVEGFARSLASLMADPGRRSELAAAAKKRAEAYSVGAMLTGLDKVYSAALSLARRP